MVNGSPTDSNAALFARGRARRHRRRATCACSPSTTRRTGAPTRRRSGWPGRSRSTATTIAGVYAANDGMAGGAISALKAANVDAVPDRHRTGCRALGDPADPHGRPAHDRLQGDQAAGRARRRGRRRAARGRGGHGAAGDRGHADDAARPGRGDRRQHPRDRRRRRILDRRRHLHAARYAACVRSGRASGRVAEHGE